MQKKALMQERKNQTLFKIPKTKSKWQKPFHTSIYFQRKCAKLTNEKSQFSRMEGKHDLSNAIFSKFT